MESLAVLLFRDTSRVRLLLLDRLSDVRLFELSLLALLGLVFFLDISDFSWPPAALFGEFEEGCVPLLLLLCRGLGLFDDLFTAEDGLSLSFKDLDRLDDL